MGKEWRRARDERSLCPAQLRGCEQMFQNLVALPHPVELDS